MALINIDLSKADQGNLIPEGEYQAIVYDVAQKQNSAQDGFYLNWQFKIRGGDQDGKTVFMITSLKENALFRLRDVLINLGFTLPADGQLNLDTEELLTKPCTLVINHRDYNNKKQNNVAEVLPAKDSGADPFDNEY